MAKTLGDLEMCSEVIVEGTCTHSVRVLVSDQFFRGKLVDASWVGRDTIAVDFGEEMMAWLEDFIG